MTDGSIYVELALPSAPTSARLLHPSQGSGASPHSQGRWTALWIGWAGNVILGVTVIALCFQTWNLMGELEKSRVPQGPQGEMENKLCLENVTSLQQFFCKPLENSSAESSDCTVCPENWFRLNSKCYWFSSEKRDWTESKDDCRTKDSQLLVIQNQEEVDFILSNIQYPLLWIGLQATPPDWKWTWVDGSPLDDKLLKDLAPAQENCCGRLNGNKTISETCTTVARWVCEKKALQITTTTRGH
ncbi:killer cell lectin-like receptor subfamily F member 1 [Podarcis muralis]